MADERLNDQPIAKDGAYVYAEDASGNQIKISKADLATVVAGVLGYKIKRQQISISAKTTVSLTAHRGLCVMHTNINRGNVVAMVNGSPEPGIVEIANNTQTAITIGASGNYIQVTNPEVEVLNLYNNSSGTCLFYIMSFVY